MERHSGRAEGASSYETHQRARYTLRDWSICTNTNGALSNSIDISLHTNLPRQATEISCVSFISEAVGIRRIPQIPAAIGTNWSGLECGLTWAVYFYCQF